MNPEQKRYARQCHKQQTNTIDVPRKFQSRSTMLQPRSKAELQRQKRPKTMPVIEVTVRSSPLANRQKSSTDESKQPWSKLLKESTSEATRSSESKASISDPVHMANFIAKELYSKLENIATSDPSILQLIADLCSALKKLSVPLHMEHTAQPTKKKLTEVVARKEMTGENPVLPQPSVQKHLEKSALKLEATCKEMEKLYSQLKAEKEELSLLLLAEKDTVKFLRQQIEELEQQKTNTGTATLRKFAEERDRLLDKIRMLEDATARPDPFTEDLKARNKQLQLEKSKFEEENITLRHMLAVSNTEKEKYVAMLDVRDRQIKEIRTEMDQFQDLLNEQLLEMQRGSVNLSEAQAAILGLRLA